MKKMMISALALLASGTTAFAADLYQPEPAPQVAAPVEVVAAGGWYLRGDTSFDYNRLKGAEYFQGSNGLVNDFDTAKLRSSYNVGAGIGYQANANLRFDATLDYMFKAKFRGSTSGTCGAGAACRSTDTSSLSAYSLMANAYVDIATIGMVTPYVGVGIGGSHLDWSKLKNTACSAANPNNCDATVSHKGSESWRFTYAVMAGASVDVTCNVKADVGYRYRHISGGNMFGYKLNGGPGYDKGLDIHEGRVGMRYNFGGCEQTYLPPVEIPHMAAVYK